MKVVAVSGIVLVTIAGTAFGDITNGAGLNSTSIGNSYRMGQSFEAVDETIHTLSFWIVDFNWVNFQDDQDLLLVLHTGPSVAGPEITRKVVSGIPDFFDGWLDFVFDPPLPTVIGNEYTIEIRDDTMRWGIRYEADAFDSYPHGVAYRLGIPWNNVDLRFRVLAAFRPGACCMDEECVEEIDAESCHSMDGTHLGTGSWCYLEPCRKVACCDYYWGSCDNRMPRHCNYGTYLIGPYATTCEQEGCPLSGHCCRGTTCTQYVLRSDCEADDGLWLGSTGQCGPGTCPPCANRSVDDDLDFDLEDVQAMQICHGLTAGGGCVCADIDDDRAVDTVDQAMFVEILTGPE